MALINRFMPFVRVLLLGLLLQAVFIILDCKQTPYQAAMDFACAYSRLDPAMVNYLYKGDDPDRQTARVLDYIDRTKTAMVKRGFDVSMAKSSLFHVKTTTVQKSDKEAEVCLTASRKTAINPVFSFVAKAFDLGRTDHVQETIKMTKEDGRWKVRGPVFELSAES
jgi:hypothetical protein